MSVVTLVRKGLKVRGRSEHNGRGVYEMSCTDTITYAELEERLEKCLVNWERRGLVEQVQRFERDGKKCVEVLFVEKLDKYYRTFVTDEVAVDKYGVLGAVLFTMTNQ